MEYEICTFCKEGYTNNSITNSKLPMMLCELKQGKFEGCLSAIDGVCMVCEEGYFIQKNSRCKSIE